MPQPDARERSKRVFATSKRVPFPFPLFTNDMASPSLIALLFACIVALAEGSKKCEPITIPLCQGIGYNQTSYPNSYGHEKQEEAGLEVHQFYPLVEVGCYRHLKFFLCTMYTPICQENYDLQVLPCQEVCLEAQRRCEPLMQQYGFKWPMTLACERLPRIADQERTGTVCAATPDTPNPMSETDANKVEVSESDLDAFQDAQDQPDDSETTDNSVRRRPASPSDSDTAIRRGQIGSDGGFPVVGIDVVDAQCQCRCVRPFHISADPSMRVHNLSNCAYACHSKGLEFAKRRYNLNTWIAVFSGICLGLSILTVLTFLIDMERFPYPERPIFFLALCQLMVSIGFLIRVGYGHDSIACNGALLRSGHGGQSGVCTLVFVLVYFFGMASSTWWVILSLTWVLAAVPQWATEWIAKYATCFHLFAWSLPALQTLLVVLFGAVEGDPITGICYVGTTNVGFQRAFVL
ncbi:frizzled/Smoothened family membrane region containing protein, partial [Aphelenchoides avenae]